MDSALKLFNSREYERSKFVLIESIRATNEPPNIDSLHLLGLCFAQLNERENAKGVFEEIKRLQPEFLNAYVRLAELFIQENDYIKALENLLHYFSRYLRFNLCFAAFDDIVQLCGKLLKGDNHDHPDFGAALSQVSICLILLTNESQQIDLFKRIYPVIEQNLVTEGKFTSIYYISILLGFNSNSPYPLIQNCFDIIMLPTLKRSMALSLYSTAISLEPLIYNAYVKSKETESHFYHSTAQYVPLFEELGKKISNALPPSPTIIIKTNEKIKIGFFVHAATYLAHIELMVTVLEGIANDKDSRITPIVYVLAHKDEKMHTRLSNCGVEIVYLSDYGKQFENDTLEKLLLLRQLIATMQVKAIVWVSNVAYMAFSFAIKTAPVQIWWSMKYHHYCGKNIDAYVTGGSFLKFKELYGRTWRSASTSLNDWYDYSVESLARDEKAKYSNYRLVLGSLGREHKLDNEDYLISVSKILQANPDCVFLWTGRQELKSITRVFEQYGVIGQTRFIGWVNTKAYAQIIDIFLDSYPFPCGFTVFQAMAAGAATVFHISNESMETGVNGMVLPAVVETENVTRECELLKDIYYSDKDKSLYCCASDSAEYVALANALISDETFRKQVSHANKRFATEVIGDTSFMCKGYEQHFYEAVVEKLGC